MADRREDILVRLLAILGSVTGIAAVARNEEDVPEGLRPAVVLFDGGEEAVEGDPDRRRLPGALRRVVMTPDIVVLLSADADDVGSEVNVLRARLVKAIATDAELNALTLNGDGIRYMGCDTNLERGRVTEAEFGLFFAIPYLLDPSQL